MKRPPGVLHCTTKYTDFGKAAGAEDYAQQEVSAAAPLPPLPSEVLSWPGLCVQWGGGGAALLTAERETAGLCVPHCPPNRKAVSMGGPTPPPVGSQKYFSPLSSPIACFG